MDAIPKHEILEFHPNTLFAVREALGLEGEGRMAEAIDLLQDWIKQQDHFIRKDFPRVYLETTLLMSKGLVEKAKQRIDKICTTRSLIPQFFGRHDAKNDLMDLHDVMKTVMLPRLTEDYYRICLLKITDKSPPASFFTDFCSFLIIISEYLKLHDYGKGFVIVLDHREGNAMDYLSKVNLIGLRNLITLITQGYGARIKEFHFMASSRMVDVLVAIAKQVLSAKLASRIHTHKTAETLYEYVPKDILPKDLGGEERSMDTLYDEWLHLLSSEEHIDFLKVMQDARIDETRRDKEFNDPCLGIPGTFRSLGVD